MVRGTETLVRSVTMFSASVSTASRLCNCCRRVSCFMLRLGKVMKTIARPGLRIRRIFEKVACFSVPRRCRCRDQETQCPHRRALRSCVRPTHCARRGTASRLAMEQRAPSGHIAARSSVAMLRTGSAASAVCNPSSRTRQAASSRHSRCRPSGRPSSRARNARRGRASYPGRRVRARKRI